MHEVPLKLFRSLGFSAMPQDEVPKKIRQFGKDVWGMRDTKRKFERLRAVMEEGLAEHTDWVTASDLRKKEEQAQRDAENRDVQEWTKKLNSFFETPALPREMPPRKRQVGQPAIALDVSFHPQKMLSDGRRVKKSDKQEHGSFVCENDRIPSETLELYHHDILRERDNSHALHRLQNKFQGYSRLMACEGYMQQA
eukprot:752584-Hanusia_phi.AAC.3